MAKTVIGKICITPKGEYNTALKYIRLDGVFYEGSYYLCRKECVGILPTSNEYWYKCAEKGEKGDKPIVGIDYFTDAEKRQFKDDVAKMVEPKVKQYSKEYIDENMKLYSLITETGNNIDITMDNNTFVIKFDLKDKNGTIISTKSIDLPLETMVIGASYNKTSKEIILTLKNGQNVEFSIADLISGLVDTNTFTAEMKKKVDKVEGKGLSTNDYTNDEKNNNSENTKVRHTHSNKSILDSITASFTTDLKNKIDANTTARHSHSNKEILDNTTASYTAEKEEQLNKNILDVSKLNENNIETAIKNYFSITPDDGVYTVRFPLWETSHACECEKLDKNKGKYLNLATDTEYEETNYGPAFDTIDCNAYVDDDGVRHVTALKGMPEFKDTGRVDVFVLGRTYYEKVYEKDGYMYYSRTYMPREGFVPCKMSVNRDGTISPYWLISKYVGGALVNEQGKRTLYSSKGLAPAHYLSNPPAGVISDGVSYSGCISLFKNKGKYYSAGTAAEYLHILTTIWLKLGTRNSQSVLAGNTTNGYQYIVSQVEENASRVIVTKAQANNIDLLSYVSVGDPGDKTNYDRSMGYMHNIANNVQVIGKEIIDDTNTALVLDCEPFTTTANTRVTTMHEKSGYSDYVLGRNGSRVSNTNGKHGAVIDGIECFVGGYEVAGNVVIDIDTETTNRVPYITNDATKLTTKIADVKSSYKKSSYAIPLSSSWKYITRVDIDLENGIAVPTSAGESGSGSATGFADGLVTDAATSGQRELLLLGSLNAGAHAGASLCYVSLGLSHAYWNFLARPSINLVGGELAVS